MQGAFSGSRPVAAMIALAACLFVAGCGGGKRGEANGDEAQAGLRVLSQGALVSSGDTLQLSTHTTVVHDTLIVAVRLRNTGPQPIRVELGGCAATPELFRTAPLGGRPFATLKRSADQLCSHPLVLLPLAVGDTLTPKDLATRVALNDLGSSVANGRYYLGADVRLGGGLGARIRLPAGTLQLER